MIYHVLLWQLLQLLLHSCYDSSAVMMPLHLEMQSTISRTHSSSSYRICSQQSCQSSPAVMMSLMSCYSFSNTAVRTHLLRWCPCCPATATPVQLSGLTCCDDIPVVMLQLLLYSCQDSPAAMKSLLSCYSYSCTAVKTHLLWWYPCCLRVGEGFLWHTPLAAAAAANTAAKAHLLWWCPCCLRVGEGSLWHTPLAAAATNTAAKAHLLWWCPCCLTGGEGSLWHTPLAAAASCYRHLWPLFGALQRSSCAPALPGRRYAAYE